MKIHHVALKVLDLEKCEKFYSEILGLKVLQYQRDLQGKVRAVWLDMEGSILMLEKVCSSTLNLTQDYNSLGWYLLSFSIPIESRKSWREYSSVLFCYIDY